jgi:alpha-beta hydrolase superfamily lysophospholipase
LVALKVLQPLLTRDPEIQAEHRADPLRHSRMSAPLFFGMVEGVVEITADPTVPP